MLVKRKFADGGFMADGGGLDPVSGNEVPVGSLKEEVRDDVDAKLSPGEFVIPADVVRFIGLERLMELRDKAKEGLKRMNDVGQMGNAEEVGEKSNQPFGAPEEEEDTSGFETEIDDILKEDEGEQTEKAFAGGGFVSGEDISKAPKNPMVDVRYFKNDDGRVMFITHINGKPMTAVPEGFKEIDEAAAKLVGKEADTKADTAEAAAEKATTSSSSAPFGRDSEGNARTSAQTNLTDKQWDMVKALRDQYGWDNEFDKQNLKDFGKAVASMFGGPLSFGATVGKMIYGKSKQELEGMDSTEYAIAKAALEADKKAGVVNQAPVEDIFERSSAYPISQSDLTTTAAKYGTDAGSEQTRMLAEQDSWFSTPAPTPTPTQTPTPAPVAKQESVSRPSSSSYAANTETARTYGTNEGSQQTAMLAAQDSEMAKGGLISKRQHPAKKQKGKGIARSSK